MAVLFPSQRVLLYVVESEATILLSPVLSLVTLGVCIALTA
jgi:hypothetical protein